MNTLTCALVGHSLSALPFGSGENSQQCRQLKAALRSETQVLIDFDCTVFLTSLSSETEVWAAEIVAERMEHDSRLKLVIVSSKKKDWRCPPSYQSRIWQLKHRGTTRLAPKEEILNLLVEQSDFVLVVCDGTDESSTGQIIRYARDRHCPVICIDPVSATVKPLKDWGFPPLLINP